DDACTFFRDGTASRAPVPGTVARGHLNSDAPLFIGRESLEEPVMAKPEGDERQAAARDRDNKQENAQALLAGEAAQFEGVVDEFPFPITRELLEHGRHRFLIYCVVCHD